MNRISHDFCYSPTWMHVTLARNCYCNRTTEVWPLRRRFIASLIYLMMIRGQCKNLSLYSLMHGKNVMKLFIQVDVYDQFWFVARVDQVILKNSCLHRARWRRRRQVVRTSNGMHCTWTESLLYTRFDFSWWYLEKTPLMHRFYPRKRWVRPELNGSKEHT